MRTIQKGTQLTRLKSGYNGNIVLRIDEIEGEEIGRVAVKATGADEKFSTVTTKVENVKGVHDLYLHFENLNGTFNFDWWRFE